MKTKYNSLQRLITKSRASTIYQPQGPEGKIKIYQISEGGKNSKY